MPPAINIVDLGSSSAGKTTLAAALCKVASKPSRAQLLNYAEINKSPAGTIIKYSTSQHEYNHAHYPDLEPCAKALRAGEFKADIAILVVSALDAVETQTSGSVALAKDLGTKHIVGVLNKCDAIDDPEILELCDGEARELLSRSGFPGDDLPVIRCSALAALQNDERWGKSIEEVFEALDDAAKV